MQQQQQQNQHTSYGAHDSLCSSHHPTISKQEPTSTGFLERLWEGRSEEGRNRKNDRGVAAREVKGRAEPRCSTSIAVADHRKRVAGVQHFGYDEGFADSGPGRNPDTYAADRADFESSA